MRILRIIAAAAVIVAPALLAAAPAQALTAKQYEHQGRGVYLNSTGSRKSYGGYRHHRSHYRTHHMHRRYR